MNTLKRVNIIVILVILSILLFAVSKSYLRADDFSHLVSVRYDTRQDITHLLTKPEYTGHYRPLIKVFFFLNYIASGLNSTSYLMAMVAIFLLNVYALFFFVRAISKSPLQAHLAVLLLLLQINIYLYTVTWAGAIASILVSLFVMASVIFYVRSVNSIPFGVPSYLLSNLCFFLGLLSKENAIVVPLVLCAYDFFFVWLNAPQKARAFGQMILRYVPFGILFAVYLLIRNASGSAAFTGAGNYTLSLGPHILSNGLFYAVQLGFLGGAMILLSLPSLLVDRLRFEQNDLRVILFGLFVASVSVLPLLPLSWTSPTWLFPPAIGTTLAMSVLFRQVLDKGAEKRAHLVLYGVILSAILGAALLFVRLNKAQWWQWGTYTQNVLLEVKKDHPDLPQGATIYFIDGNKGKEYGIENLFRNHPGSALQVWYDDPSIEAYIVADAADIEKHNKKGEEQVIFVFEYYDGHITDKTETFR